MVRYIFKRVMFAIPTLLAMSFIVFVIIDASPADPCAQAGAMPAEQRAAICAQFGRDAPLVARYGEWFVQFFIHEPAHFIFGEA